MVVQIDYVYSAARHLGLWGDWGGKDHAYSWLGASKSL